MKHLLLLLVWLMVVMPGSLRGDAPSTKPQEASVGSKVSLTMKFKITAPPDTKLVLNVLVPRSIPGRQKIVDTHYSVKPSEIFEKDGDLFARFALEKLPRSSDVSINVDAEIYRYDLATASADAKNRLLEKKYDLGKWLNTNETYLDCRSSEIQRVAKSIPGKNDEEIVRNCFDYVLNNLKKGPYDEKDHGAVWALQRKQGDCTEFADLFVTLCRTKGIPARFVRGYLLDPVTDTPKHDWGEVYFEQYGWVPFDPTYTKLKKATTYSEMRPIYLLLDVQRQNATLNNHHYWSYTFTSSGAPISPGSVQVKESFNVYNRDTLKSE